MNSLPKHLVAIGDSSVYGWGDNEGGGWCERLRKDFAQAGGQFKDKIDEAFEKIKSLI